MAKATKSRKAKEAHADPQKIVGPRPMTGIEKAAWWSVPMLGFVVLACGGTLGVLFAIKPEPPVRQSLAQQPAKVEKLGASETKKRRPNKRNVEAGRAEVVSATKKAAVSPARGSLGKDPGNAPVKARADMPDASNETAANEITPVTLSTAATDANTLTSLVCADGKIQFQGTSDPVFVETQPLLETIEKGGIKFDHLVFDGSDQSVELPDVPKNGGSIDMVCKLPASATSILLDSNFQRLTVRKNRDGFRWRIDAKKKTNKIRLSPAKLDYNEWQHVVITWNEGDDAVLYINGDEQDRLDYVNEQPQFANFQKIVLGRTRGPNGRFYECRVHRYKVFDQPMTAAEIAAQYSELKSSFPFIFK